MTTWRGTDERGEQPDSFIRLIERRDELGLAMLLSEGGAEFGTIGAGFEPNGHEEVRLTGLYAAPRSAYYVLERIGLTAGGAGIAPLLGAPDIAELQRFVLMPMTGRATHGRRLLHHALSAADKFGYRCAYVEVNSAQFAMLDLLRLAGFERLQLPLRNPPTQGLDTYHLLKLKIP
jgi:putative acetyltransferase